MENEPTKRLAITLNTVLPAVLTVILFVLTISWLMLPILEKNLMAKKREMIRELTELAVGTISIYMSREQSGQLTHEEAQAQAVEHLRNLRYGPEGKDYFWINDMHPRMIMHPYRPDLEGSDISHFKDPNGKLLFTEFVKTVKAAGSGYVDYQWQWKDEPDRIVPKISYVKEFIPWKWIVGTGIYVEDVREEIASITRKLTLMYLGILGIIMALSSYIIWHSNRVENARRKAVEDLQKSEQRYRLLAETAQDAIITFDMDGVISYINNAGLSITGHSDAELLGADIKILFPDDRYENLSTYIESNVSGEVENSLFETEIANKDGAWIPVEISLSILSEKKTPTSVFVFARNITQKKEAEKQAKLHQEQLFQAAKMASLGTLVSGVAHEINNPVTSVMLNAPIIKRVWDSVTPILDEYISQRGDIVVGNMSYEQLRNRMPFLLDDITDGARRVRSIVGDLKDFAQQRPTEMADMVDANRVVKKSIGLVSNLIHKSTGNFKVRYGDAIPTFKGNTQRIEQVIINLLVNSCQSLPDNQRAIAIKTEFLSEITAVVIEVSDEGDGMPEDVLARIKDPFFTTKRESGGTGLGLAISDKIIRDHGGSMDFKSSPGKGTVVKVTIPISNAKSDTE